MNITDRNTNIKEQQAYYPFIVANTSIIMAVLYNDTNGSAIIDIQVAQLKVTLITKHCKLRRKCRIHKGIKN